MRIDNEGMVHEAFGTKITSPEELIGARVSALFYYTKDATIFRQLVQTTISKGVPSIMTTTLYYQGNIFDARIQIQKYGPDGAIVRTRQLDEI